MLLQLNFGERNIIMYDCNNFSYMVFSPVWNFFTLILMFSIGLSSFNLSAIFLFILMLVVGDSFPTQTTPLKYKNSYTSLKNRLQNLGPSTQFSESVYRIHVYLNEIVDLLHDLGQLWTGSTISSHITVMLRQSMLMWMEIVDLIQFFFSYPNKLPKIVVVFQFFLFSNSVIPSSFLRKGVLGFFCFFNVV